MQKKITIEELRKFAATISVALLVLVVAFFALGHDGINQYLVGASALIALLGAIAPSLLFYPYRGWTALAIVLNYIVTRVILLAVFLLLVTLISLIARLFRKQFLALDWRPEGIKSYWEYREKTRPQKENYEQQF